MHRLSNGHFESMATASRSGELTSPISQPKTEATPTSAGAAPSQSDVVRSHNGQSTFGAFQQPVSPSPKKAAFSLETFRVPQGFELQSTETAQLVIPVGKPIKEQFFRAHPEWNFCARILEHARRTYIVSSVLGEDLEGDAKLRHLVPCITRDGNLFLWSLGIIKASGQTDSWTLSAHRALQSSRTSWCRLVSDANAGAYRMIKPQVAWPDPVWPPLLTFDQMLEIAFEDSIVESVDHPVLRWLRGEV